MTQQANQTAKPVQMSRTRFYKLLKLRVHRRRKAGLITAKEAKELYAALKQVWSSISQEPYQSWNVYATSLATAFLFEFTPQGFAYWHQWNKRLFPELYNGKRATLF